MPITCPLMFLCLLGILLFVPALALAVLLLVVKRRVEALVVLGIPISMIFLSILLTLAVVAGAEVQSRVMSACPNLLFREMFGFKPPAQTHVLKAYHSEYLDYATTVMEFTTTMDTIDRITAHGFKPVDRVAFMNSYEGNSHNLPRRVQSWFLSPREDPEHFFMASGSFGCNEAILCYDEETGLAHFHWVGLD